jgi:uncharacterized protein YkwD
MAAVATVLLGPPNASAAEQCLYQGVKVTAKNEATVERAVLCLTNLHRFRKGLTPLKADSRLNVAARRHSADMVARGFFDHVSPEGTTPSTRAMAVGYPGGAGENIAATGIGTAASLFETWKKSSGHNANMLTPGYVAIGVGAAPGFPGGGGGGGAVTATQMFGFSSANSGDTGLDLYASSDKCAKARAKLIAAKRSGKKKGRKRLRAQVRRYCKPLR